MQALPATHVNLQKWMVLRGHMRRWLQFSQVWVNATDTLTQEEAVMEAIYTKGPMTVSVNAEGEDWRFYKTGVYNNTRCSPKLKKLDHAVVLSGCAAS
jgi:hypothetical protein